MSAVLAPINVLIDADLAKSGLTADDRKLLKITPAPADEIGQLRHAYRIPYFDLKRKPNGFERYRFVEQIRDDDPKYHQAKGSGVHIYFPPYINWDKEVLADISIPVIITEGEKKAAAMTKAGFPCIGIGGVDMWRRNGQLHPDLAALAKGGRQITVVFDSDHAVKDGPQRARRDLIDALVLAGANVGFADIQPKGAEKQGLDDLIVADGKEAVTALLAQRQLAHAALVAKPLDPTWLSTAPPPYEWVWDGRILKATNTTLAGAGGVGKSSLLIKLAIATATGADKLCGAALNGGPVVIVEAEDGEAIMRRRIYRYCQRRIQHFARKMADGKITKAQYTQAVAEFDKGMCQNLHILCVAGGELHLIDSSTGHIKQSSVVSVLIARLKAINPVLVIFDPMARLHGGDENANSLGTAMINALERVALGTGAAVLLSHHFNKQAIGDGRQDVTAVRGGSAIVDGSRSVFTMAEANDAALKGLRLQYADAAGQVTEVTGEHVKDGRVVILRHVKCNHAARAKDVFLLRGQHGELSTLMVSSMDAADTYNRNLTALHGWAGNTPFTKNLVRTKANEFGMAQHAAEALVEQAMIRGDMVEVVGFQARNPRTKGLQFSDAYRPTAQILPNSGRAISGENGGGGAGIPPTTPPGIGWAVSVGGISDTPTAPVSGDTAHIPPRKSGRRAKPNGATVLPFGGAAIRPDWVVRICFLE